MTNVSNEKGCAGIPIHCLEEDNIEACKLISRVAGVALLVVALLAGTNIIGLDPLITAGIAALGGGLCFAAGSRESAKSCAAQTWTVALQVIAVAAIVVGSLGMSGHIPVFAGSVGTLIMGSGAILMTLNAVPFYCFYPFNTTTD